MSNNAAYDATRLEIGEEDLRAWLDAYGRAWEGHDSAAVAGLFTEDASYQIRPSPFAGPLRGRQEILDYWRWSTGSATEISFEFEVLDAAGESGAARWSAWIREDDTLQRVEGIFLVVLSPDRRCCELHEWWNTDRLSGPGPDQAPFT
jgi:hypothetical protein